MKRIYLTYLIILFLLISFSIASIQVIEPLNNETDAGIMQLINLSLNGTNITQVNITFSKNIFAYINNSNGTSSNSTFNWYENTESYVLTWKNASGTWLINETTGDYFWFNVTSNKSVDGEFNLTVKMINLTDDVVEEKNVTIKVNPTLWSIYGEFYVKPVDITLNWSNNYQASVTLIVNNTLNYSIQAGVDNYTTEIIGNYSQREFGAYSKYGPEPLGTGCFPDLSDSTRDNPLTIKVNGTFTNRTTDLSTSQHANITFIQSVICPPGKYFGYVEIYNLTNSSEKIDFPITIHIPITTQNILDESTGKGTFYGKVLSNQTYYHSYFFNSSNITNATYVYINLSWDNSSKDIDLFLLDYETENLLVKSINENEFEELYANLIPGKIYEIRIYGNITQEDYEGTISFSTLKLLNASNLSQQFSSLSFGTLNITNSSTLDLTLKNFGDINFSNIQQGIIIYHLDTFHQSNGKANNFTFFVPSFAQKVKVSINWTGNASYNLTLYDPNSNLIGYSSSKQNIANMVNVEKEEFVETASISEGYWKIQVTNLTNNTNAYTVFAKFYVNEDWWFNSNYSTSNYSGFGSNQTFNLTLTVPKNATSGTYEGYIIYHGSGGIKIPFELNVSTSTFLINNSTQSATIIINDNIGFNRSIIFNVTIKNIGNKNLTFDQILNSTNLTGANGSYMDFDFNLPATIIQPNQSVNLTINITLDTTKTQDKITIYTGWINFTSNNSGPYQKFNLILKVNLTDLLKVSISNVDTSLGNNYINSTKDENITINLKVFYINGTSIYTLTLENNNFKNAKIIQKNVIINRKYYTINISNLFNYTTLLWTGETYGYRINATILTNSSNIPGGNYTFYIDVAHVLNSSGKIYTYKGKGSYYPLIINTSGFYINSTKSSITIQNQSLTNFTVNIYNLGPISDSTTLHFSRGNCPIQITNTYYCSVGSCSALSGHQNVSLTLQAYDLSGNVNITWTIKGDGSGSCTAKIYGSSRWYNNLSLSIKVNPTPTEEEEEEVTIPTPTPTQNVTLIADFIFYEFEDLILIQQNSTNSTLVKIKNVGDVDQNVTLSIENINLNWYTISPKTQEIKPNETKTFSITFKIEFPEIKDYSGKYKASSPNKTIEKSFTLRVLPSEENETKLMEEIEEIKSNLTKLEEEIIQLKNEGYNVTEAENLLNESKKKLERIESYVQEKNYKEAYRLLEELKSDIESIKERIEKAKIPKGIFEILIEFLGKYGIYIVIPLILIFGGLLIYMFLPPKEVKYYKPKKKKFVWRVRGKLIRDKINEEYEKLKEKWKGKFRKEK